ncbi:MAG: spore cortex biosynthesis protein YabQ [Oscillospiraceae bacterium]|nr:spore cortex biosynthesis protein YabQ [Oscillospiraceae bacterium]
MDFNPGSFLGVLGELRMLGLAAVVGALLGAVFDILRVFRMSFPHRAWMVFLEDFLFVWFFGMVFFLFSVEMLEGSLRFYVIAGMIAGFGIYLLTLGRIISGMFRMAGNIFRKIEKLVMEKLKTVLPAKKFPGKIKKSS